MYISYEIPTTGEINLSNILGTEHLFFRVFLSAYFLNTFEHIEILFNKNGVLTWDILGSLTDWCLRYVQFSLIITWHPVQEQD